MSAFYITYTLRKLSANFQILFLSGLYCFAQWTIITTTIVIIITMKIHFFLIISEWYIIAALRSIPLLYDRLSFYLNQYCDFRTDTISIICSNRCDISWSRFFLTLKRLLYINSTDMRLSYCWPQTASTSYVVIPSVSHSITTININVILTHCPSFWCVMMV